MSEIICNSYANYCCELTSTDSNNVTRSAARIRRWAENLLSSEKQHRKVHLAADLLSSMSDHQLRDIGMDRSQLGTKSALERHQHLLNRLII